MTINTITDKLPKKFLMRLKRGKYYNIKKTNNPIYVYLQEALNIHFSQKVFMKTF